MAVAVPDKGLTLADLVDRFGPMPAERIRTNPPPGTATEQDVIDIEERESRLCELVDGVLVEKTVGVDESYLASRLIYFLNEFVLESGLGVVTAPDGMMRLAPGLVRIPDVSFIFVEPVARTPGSTGADSRPGAGPGGRGRQSGQHGPRDGAKVAGIPGRRRAAGVVRSAAGARGARVHR